MTDDEENLALFRAEAEDLLSEITESVLSLESDGTTASKVEHIHLIFRSVHTLKGLGGMCDLVELTGFAHRIETVLETARAGRLVWNSAMTSAMLAALDYLQILVKIAPENAEDPKAEQLLLALESIAAPGESPDAPVANQETISEPLSAPSDSVSPVLDPKAQTTQGLRISTERLDRLVEAVSQIVVIQAQLSAIGSKSSEKQWAQPLEELGNLVDTLRNVTMQIRMMPVANIFRSLTRSVRDLAEDLGKEVDFVTTGGDTEIDKTVFDRLTNPLLHLVRNSLDHGIASPAERLKAGKTPTGTLKLHAAHHASQVVFTLSDDGDGVPLDAVQKRAMELGFFPPGHAPSPKELHAVVFKPGFSTKTEVTEISGRGVGLDAVKRQVDLLRGTVELESSPGNGTTVTLRLPLTLAIIDGLLLEVNESSYVLPLSSVSECVKFVPEAGDRFAPMIRIRSEAVPFLDVRELFELIPGGAVRTGVAVVVEHNSERFALVVDRVLGNLQTVVKSIGTRFHRTNLIAGATILGDGGIALILDPVGLAAELKKRNVSHSSS